MSELPPEITLEARDRITWITLNRPHKANALTAAMLEALERSLAECAANDAVGGVVLTGAGTRAFSAGADLTPPPDNPAAHRAQRRARLATARLRCSSRKPEWPRSRRACGAG